MQGESTCTSAHTPVKSAPPFWGGDATNKCNLFTEEMIKSMVVLIERVNTCCCNTRSSTTRVTSSIPKYATDSQNLLVFINK
jgi:hypothetical protein